MENVAAKTIEYEYGKIKLNIDGSNITLKTISKLIHVLMDFDKNSLEQKYTPNMYNVPKIPPIRYVIFKFVIKTL